MSTTEPTLSACTNCNGKGFNTRCYDEVGSDDFGGEGYARRGLIQKVPCKKCPPPTQDKQSDFVDPNGNHIVPDVVPLADKQCPAPTPKTPEQVAEDLELTLAFFNESESISFPTPKP